jgi:serine/threonine-protein kinase
MELVEGEDLSERIAKGPIPLEEALPIALQIAGALEDAHEKGFIHRDLKPANIKLTPEGKVKVLDFGLAKALEEERNDENIANSPTLTMQATQAGIILGTAAYMSPEQAKGQPVDRRADIWAFGAVLYEMLAGQQAFEGSDLSEVMAAVIMKVVDFDVLPGIAPNSIRRLIARCLARDIRGRLQHIGEARILIEEYLAGPTEDAIEEAITSVAPQPLRRRLVPWAVAGAVAIALISLIATGLFTPQPAPRPLTRIAMVLPSSQRLTGTGRHVVASSPDGTHLVYSAENQLYLRAMDQLGATPLSGTAGARSPFFSPDGQWVGFWAGGELKKVSISGGTPMTLCETRSPLGASWAGDDRILFARGDEGIFQVSAAGGTKDLLIRLNPGEFAWGPQMLPGGQSVLFTLDKTTGWNDAQLVVHSLETGERTVLIQGGTDVRYVPTGHLVYLRAGTLLAVPFDVGNLEVRGDPVPVMEGVRQATGGNGGAQFSFSGLGSLFYVPGTITSENTLVWVDRDGAEKPIAVGLRPYGQPRLSPDGGMLALEIEGDLWMYDFVRGTTTRVTFDGGSRPAWTPDGKRIVFTRSSGLFIVPVDGSSEAEQLTEGSQYHSNAVSPDGQILLLHAHNESEDALMLQLDSQSEPQPWLATAFSEVGTAFSPDGKWIVYVSNESGQSEIYVRPFPGPGGRTKISTDGGNQPMWKASGEIFYKQDDRMMAVQIQTEPELNLSRPRELFTGQYVYGNVGPFPSYDVTPDGHQFVMVKEGGETGATRQEIILVLNWFEELKRLAPTDPH